MAGLDNVSGCGVTVCETILSELVKAKTETMALLGCYDVYVFPSVNPDCELLGNSFCSASGTDLRMATQYSKVLQPELFYLKKALNNINVEQGIGMVIEICGDVDR